MELNNRKAEPGSEKTKTAAHTSEHTLRTSSWPVNWLTMRMRRRFFERFPIKYFSLRHHGVPKSVSHVVTGSRGGMCTYLPKGVNGMRTLRSGSTHVLGSLVFLSNQCEMSWPANLRIGWTRMPTRNRRTRNGRSMLCFLLGPLCSQNKNAVTSVLADERGQVVDLVKV